MIVVADVGVANAVTVSNNFIRSCCYCYSSSKFSFKIHSFYKVVGHWTQNLLHIKIKYQLQKNTYGYL